MKKILVMLAIVFGCSMISNMDAKRNDCCKKTCKTQKCKTACQNDDACKTKQKECVTCKAEPCKRIEKRKVLVKCPRTEWIPVEKIDFKEVEQEREICEIPYVRKEGPYRCINNDCCGNGVIIETEEQLNCTSPACIAAKNKMGLKNHKHQTVAVKEEVLTEAQAEAGEE